MTYFTDDGLIPHLPIRNVRLNQAEHLLGRPCNLDEDTIVNLEQAEELQNFSGFGCDLINTE